MTRNFKQTIDWLLENITHSMQLDWLSLSEACSSGNLEVLKYIYDNHGDKMDWLGTHSTSGCFPVYANGCTALCRAAVHGHSDIVRWILETIPEVMEKNQSEPLSDPIARVWRGKPKRLKELRIIENFRPGSIFKWLTNGKYRRVSPLRCRPEDKRDCLHICAQSGDIDLLEWTLRVIPGPWDMSAEDDSGNTIVQVAASLGHQDFVEYVERVTDKITIKPRQST